MALTLQRGDGPLVDADVIGIINESHELAKSLLQQHRALLDALVQALLERETLDEQEILEVTSLPPALHSRALASPRQSMLSAKQAAAYAR